jgi:ABC-type multidrug transport system ATPase subunit
MVLVPPGSVKGRVLASAGADRRDEQGGGVLASSTPDALWASPSARLVRPAAVACREVTRQPLLRRCSFRVAPGVRLLIVGEPHESASLLVRVLAGLARPSSGRVVVAGIEGPEAARRGARVSYLGREPGIHGWMTPREAVGLAASLLGLDAADAARRTADALAWVQIDERDLDRAVRRGGPALAQRVGLAAALVGDPEVLLLDEPLRALAQDDRERLLSIPGRRRSILLASRYPRGDARLVTHVMLIRAGRVATLAPVVELAAAGLPLSREGIVAYADLHAPRATAPPGPGTAAPAR